MSFGLRDDQLVQLARHAPQVGSHKIGHHLRGFGIHLIAFLLHVAIDERRHLLFFQLLRLKHHTHFSRFVHPFLATVDFPMLVADDQNGRFQRLLEVKRQFVHVLDVLCLFHHHHLVFGHHGIAFGGIDDSGYIHVRSVGNGKVELLLTIGQHMIDDIVGYLIDVIAFITHQQIDGRILLSPEAGHDIIKCKFLFCHNLPFVFQVFDCLLLLDNHTQCLDANLHMLVHKL